MRLPSQAAKARASSDIFGAFGESLILAAWRSAGKGKGEGEEKGLRAMVPVFIAL